MQQLVYPDQHCVLPVLFPVPLQLHTLILTTVLIKHPPILNQVFVKSAATLRNLHLSIPHNQDLYIKVAKTIHSKAHNITHLTLHRQDPPPFSVFHFHDTVSEDEDLPLPDGQLSVVLSSFTNLKSLTLILDDPLYIKQALSLLDNIAIETLVIETDTDL